MNTIIFSPLLYDTEKRMKISENQLLTLCGSGLRGVHFFDQISQKQNAGHGMFF